MKNEKRYIYRVLEEVLLTVIDKVMFGRFKAPSHIDVSTQLKKFMLSKKSYMFSSTLQKF